MIKVLYINTCTIQFNRYVWTWYLVLVLLLLKTPLIFLKCFIKVSQQSLNTINILDFCIERITWAIGSNHFPTHLCTLWPWNLWPWPSNIQRTMGFTLFQVHFVFLFDKIHNRCVYYPICIFWIFWPWTTWPWSWPKVKWYQPYIVLFYGL